MIQKSIHNYNNRKSAILVTGGSGFIGSEVVFQLSKRKNRIIVVDSKKPSYKISGVHFIKHDLRRLPGLEKLFSQVDTCIHLAAHIGNVSYGMNNQSKMLEDNLLIDTNTISSAAKAGVKNFIYISSSLVYEQAKKFPAKESDADLLPIPRLAYSFEKALGEKICQTFSQDYGMDYTICRLFNAFGMNSNHQEDIRKHVISDLLEKIISGQYPLQIYGDGKQKRNFTHVKDLASAILSTVHNTHARNEVFNFGNNKEYSILELIHIMWTLLDIKKPLKLTHLTGFKNDVSRNYPDVAKTKRVLRWQAKISVKEGIREIIRHKTSLSLSSDYHK